MRSKLIEDLRAEGSPLCAEAAAELEAIEARAQAGAALNAMLVNQDTPLGKHALANAMTAVFIPYGVSHNELGPEGITLLTSIQQMLSGMLSGLAMNLRNGSP